MYPQLEGHFTIVVIHHDHPDLLVGVRCETPLVVGVGKEEAFIASSVAAFLAETKIVHFPADGEIIEITPAGARFWVDGKEVVREAEEVPWDQEIAEKGGFETFMLKEIYEQPEAVRETIGDRVRGHDLVLEALGMTEVEIQNLRRIVIVAARRTTPPSPAATSSRSGRAFRSSRTSRASGSTATRCSRRTRS